MSTGELILYQTEDGLTKVNLRAIEGTVWLTQGEIADLFDKGRSTVAEHIQNILTEGELEKNSVCRNFRRTAKDGKSYNTKHYQLSAIIAVGYKVNSEHAVQFCKWATTIIYRQVIERGKKMKQINNQHYKTFEKIRHHTEEGIEFWSARALLPILEYRSWDKFKAVIRKAVKACENSGIQLQEHFSQVGKMVKIGSGAERYIKDYGMS